VWCLLWILAFLSYLGFYSFVFVTPVRDTFDMNVHFQYDNDRIEETYAIVHIPPKIISRNQHYSLTIYLSLPESEKNCDAGMFMIYGRLDDLSHNGTDFSRPAVLKYRSTLLRTLYTIFYSFPLLLGFQTFDEKQSLTIPLLEDFVFPKADNYLKINISNPKIQIYSSHIKIVANLFGLSYYIYWYFYTSLIIGTTFLFVCYAISFIIVAIIGIYHYYPLIMAENIPKNQEDEIPIEEMFKD